MREWPLEDTRTGSTTRWGSSPCCATPATRLDRRGCGEHAGLHGRDVEVADDAVHLRDAPFRDRCCDGADTLGVLCRHGRDGRRGVHREGAEGSKVGLDARPAPGVRPRDRQHGEGLHLYNLNDRPSSG